MKFEWDETKNQINIKKHGVSFEEAKTTFDDEFALFDYDDNNSNDEDRFRLLGESAKGFVLLVVHCIRNGDTIRIISARHATNIEKRYYYENNGGRL